MESSPVESSAPLLRVSFDAERLRRADTLRKKPLLLLPLLEPGSGDKVVVDMEADSDCPSCGRRSVSCVALLGVGDELRVDGGQPPSVLHFGDWEETLGLVVGGRDWLEKDVTEKLFDEG